VGLQGGAKESGGRENRPGGDCERKEKNTRIELAVMCTMSLV